jgi:hypothetical protein
VFGNILEEQHENAKGRSWAERKLRQHANTMLFAAPKVMVMHAAPLKSHGREKKISFARPFGDAARTTGIRIYFLKVETARVVRPAATWPDQCVY